MAIGKGVLSLRFIRTKGQTESGNHGATQRKIRGEAHFPWATAWERMRSWKKNAARGATVHEIYIRYHDEEWGVPVHDDRRLFEMLILEGAQAGLSWLTILKKRDNYRGAFDDFDAAKIARYGDAKVARAARRPRHRPQPAEGRRRRHERAGLPELATRRRSFDGFPLAVRRRQTAAQRVDVDCAKCPHARPSPTR